MSYYKWEYIAIKSFYLFRYDAIRNVYSFRKICDVLIGLLMQLWVLNEKQDDDILIFLPDRNTIWN